MSLSHSLFITLSSIDLCCYSEVYSHYQVGSVGPVSVQVDDEAFSGAAVVCWLCCMDVVWCAVVLCCLYLPSAHLRKKERRLLVS